MNKQKRSLSADVRTSTQIQRAPSPFMEDGLGYNRNSIRNVSLICENLRNLRIVSFPAFLRVLRFKANHGLPK